MCDSNLTTNLAGRLAEAVEEAARRDGAEAVPIRFATPLALGSALRDDVVLVLFVAPPDVVAVAQELGSWALAERRPRRRSRMAVR